LWEHNHHWMTPHMLASCHCFCRDCSCASNCGGWSTSSLLWSNDTLSMELYYTIVPCEENMLWRWRYHLYDHDIVSIVLILYDFGLTIVSPLSYNHRVCSSDVCHAHILRYVRFRTWNGAQGTLTSRQN